MELDNKIYNYILRMRIKVLKLYLIEIYEKYQNLLSFNNNNFLDEEMISIIEPDYKLVIEKLNLALCKLGRSNIQIGGSKTQKTQFNFDKNQYINQINQMQQRIMYLSNYNAQLSQQLQQCGMNNKLLEIEKSSLADKLLFFDKSLETVAQAVSNNISNGEQKINLLSEFIKSKKSDPAKEHTVNLIIDGDKIDIR
jgi:hypothetical protein